VRRGEVTWFSVTDACNAHCVFCAQHVPRMTADLRDRSVLHRLKAMLVGGVPAELLLTGGEPTLHPLLHEVIAAARAAGVERVVVYSNAMAFADPARLKRWQDAGLTGLRATLVAPSPAANALMRHPKSWELASVGVQAAIDAGLHVQVATTLNQRTAPHLGALARHLVTHWPQVDRLVLQPHVARPPGAPTAQHVPPRDLETNLADAIKVLRASGVVVSPDPGYGYHLCAFNKPRAVASMFRHGAPSGAAQLTLLAGCERCVLAKRCGGVEASLAAAYGEAVIKPVTDARRAAWQPVFERTEASDRTDRVDVREKRGDTEFMREHVIRILHACNQRCAFCWIDFDAPTMSVEQVRAAIQENLARANGRHVSIAYTGGEPTMHPQLLELVALAKQLGAQRVHLQTNAVKAADPKLAAKLGAAGVDEALVSLHASTAADSDRLTAAPGTFERSIAGIRNLCEAGVDVVINHVLTAQLAPRFVDFVRFVHARLAHPRLILSVAVAGRIDRGPLDDSVLPRLSELAAPVGEGLRLANKLGLQVRDLVHPCGVPPCVVGGDPEIFDVDKMRVVSTSGVVGEAEGCVKPESCRACLFDRYCYGVRREYADDHGTAELVPVTAGVDGGRRG
jgi:MoaA/NifB/PqqE/SkfB family radical SAM enzyme